MKHSIPSRMQAVFIQPENNQLTVKEVDVPVPGKGEVLIKVHAAPVNPTDLAKIREADPLKEPDFIPGTEGSGLVVAAGKGILPAFFKGKRVAFFAKYPKSGAWAEYVVTTAGSCFPISRSVADEQAAMAIVNPMTAMAFLDYAKKEKHKAVVLTAAGGALGKMVSTLLGNNNIQVLSVVRSEDAASRLREEGRKHIMTSSDTEFIEKLTAWCEEYKARLVLDAVGGGFINKILPLMPPDSSILLYGNLSQEKIEFMPTELVRKHNKIIGFFLGSWISNKGMLKTIAILMKVNRMLKQGMETRIRGSYALQDVNEAIAAYESNMSAGKVILTSQRPGAEMSKP